MSDFPRHETPLDNPSHGYRPCPHCAESVKLEATVCRHCQGNITVDVIFEQGPRGAGAKELHQAALQLMRFKTGRFTYQELKRKLATSGAALLQRVSYAEAEEFKKFAAAAQVTVRSTTAVTHPAEQLEEAPETRRLVLRLSGYHFILVGAILLGGFWLQQKLGRHPSVPTISNPTAESSANSTPSPANEMPAPASGEKQNVSIQDALIRATVTVVDDEALGSGFFIHPRGYLITNVHVIEHMRAPKVIMEDGRRLSATVVRVDRGLDIALLSVSGGEFPYLALGDATALSRGETVWTVGAPRGLSFSLTKGIVSFVGRNINGTAYLQSDASINPGNSGGPMINEKGQVVGINTFIIKDAEGLGFALPINYLFMIDRPILEGIVGNVAPTALMRTWLTYPNSPPDVVATTRRNAPSSNSPNRNDTTDESHLLSLAKEAKTLDSNFAADRNRANQSINSLYAEKQAIESKYQNSAGLSISEETKLGRQLKELNGKVLDAQLALLARTADYYHAKLRNLQETLDIATDASLAQQVKGVLVDVKGLIDKNQADIEAKQKELQLLKSQAY